MVCPLDPTKTYTPCVVQGYLECKRRTGSKCSASGTISEINATLLGALMAMQGLPTHRLSVTPTSRSADWMPTKLKRAGYGPR